MLKKNATILSVIMTCMLAFPAVNVNAATTKQSTIKQFSIKQSSILQSTTSTTTQAVKITDFGAHSITEKGYETFDSSQAIKNAIKYAVANKISSVDFGSGKYYASNIQLASNITYFSTEGAELIASPTIQVWQSVLASYKTSNITIRGLSLNGNWDVVPGDMFSGSMLIGLTGSTNVIIENCYLYHSQSLGILMQNGCNYITIRNNKIYDTDAGIISTNGPSNYITIDNNIIYGDKIQRSEPISIYSSNSSSLAHDIIITNNTLHDKLEGSAIYVMNATKVQIKGNIAYNCYAGINIGIDAFVTGDKVTTSSDITISENSVHNCTVGIIGEVNNSIVSKNTLSNIKGIGIQLFTKNSKSPIINDIIINNTITNINSLGAQEPAIRLGNSWKCIIDNNNVLDTRTPAMHWFAIQVSGKDSMNNTVRNNSNLGATVKGGYQIYVQNANNTTLENNTATILDQGVSTIIQNSN